MSNVLRIRANKTGVPGVTLAESRRWVAVSPVLSDSDVQETSVFYEVEVDSKTPAIAVNAEDPARVVQKVTYGGSKVDPGVVTKKLQWTFEIPRAYPVPDTIVLSGVEYKPDVFGNVTIDALRVSKYVTTSEVDLSNRLGTPDGTGRARFLTVEELWFAVASWHNGMLDRTGVFLNVQITDGNVVLVSWNADNIDAPGDIIFTERVPEIVPESRYLDGEATDIMSGGAVHRLLLNEDRLVELAAEAVVSDLESVILSLGE